MRIKQQWMSPKQKEAHYEKVAGFLAWLGKHNATVLVRYNEHLDTVIPLSHKEIEKLMSQYCGVNLTIKTVMGEMEF